MRFSSTRIYLGVMCALFATGLLQAQRGSQAQGHPSPYKAVLDRLESMTSVPLNQWHYHAANFPHPEDPALDDSNWSAVMFGRNAAAPDSTDEPRWYRTWVEVPSAAGGRDVRGARIHLVLHASSLARVFFNGTMVAQGSGRLLLPILITEKAAPGERLLVAVATSRLTSARLSIDYPGKADAYLLRREIMSAEALLAGFPEGGSERERLLDTAVHAIDIAALDRGDQQVFAASLEAANLDLQPLHEWMKQFSIQAVGNSHIDMAWLWPWTETVEVVRDTFTTVLQLMREYPEFTYTQSTAQDFEWLEEKYPDLFRQIQQRVKEGRWEIVGGMWVEPDLNMPDGESLVRQLLVGKRYFRNKLGVDVNIGWNPDSFGYNWQLPQIYKKSGIDYFVTQKMSWNETTEFPYKLFWWQSPDGSRVLTYFPHDYDNPRTVDNGIDPVSIAKDVATYVPAMKFPKIMHLYGVGDHGGGPTRAMLDDMLSLRDPSVAFPPISFSTSKAFFDDLQRSLNTGALKPPVWNDELYLEYHRGCYTTQSETKKLVRQSEELLQNAEKFAALSFLAGHTYPQSIIEESWKKVLFDQFHDILPGSGVAVNYTDAARNLGEVSLNGEKVLGESLAVLTARANTAGVGAPFVIFNPLSWARTGSVVVETDTPGPGRHLEVRNAAGELLPSQAASTHAVTGTTKMRVLVRAVPPLGYEVIHLVPVANVRTSASMLRATGTTLENEFVRVEVDPQTGCITSLVNKADGKNVIATGGCGNLLQTFVDKPLKQDAWEIRFDQQFWDLKQPQEVKVVESGPVRAVIRVKNKFQNSTFVQDICLYAGVPRVDVEMQVEWHEQHILLKVGVPVDVQTDVATYEIPYGTIQRPTTRRTPAEQAKFEVPALRWGDLSNANHGLSLLNASKYGYDAKDNVIRLSLLRAATYPGVGGECCTDQGFHELTYSLFAHKGGWEAGGTTQQAYELNFPLMAIAAGAHTGVLPAKHSFVQVEPGNVVLTAVKKAEDDDGLILRFYESNGKPSQVRLHLPDKAVRAFETSLMEKQQDSLPLTADGREVAIPIGAYEIKTVKVLFAVSTGQGSKLGQE